MLILALLTQLFQVEAADDKYRLLHCPLDNLCDPFELAGSHQYVCEQPPVSQTVLLGSFTEYVFDKLIKPNCSSAGDGRIWATVKNLINVQTPPEDRSMQQDQATCAITDLEQKRAGYKEMLKKDFAAYQDRLRNDPQFAASISAVAADAICKMDLTNKGLETELLLLYIMHLMNASDWKKAEYQADFKLFQQCLAAEKEKMVRKWNRSAACKCLVCLANSVTSLVACFSTVATCGMVSLWLYDDEEDAYCSCRCCALCKYSNRPVPVLMSWWLAFTYIPSTHTSSHSGGSEVLDGFLSS